MAYLDVQEKHETSSSQEALKIRLGWIKVQRGNSHSRRSKSMQKTSEMSSKRLIVVAALVLLSSVTLYAVGQKEKQEKAKPGEPAGTSNSSSTSPLELKDSIELTDAVLKAEDLMQRGRFREAGEVLAKGPVPSNKQMYAIWLQALALYQVSDYVPALRICTENMEKPSPWQHKIRFLAAEIYLKQKRFREAEAIYDRESQRLLAEERKEEIAKVYISFAESLSYTPKPEELDLPEPDFDEAYSFYAKALELEIGHELSEEIRFRMALMRERDELYYDAAEEYRSYLRDFDPDWKRRDYGPRSASYRGGHRAAARYRLAESLIRTGDFQLARTELEDLIDLLELAGESPGGTTTSGGTDTVTVGSANDDMDDPTEISTWQRLAMRRIPFTYGFPHPGSTGDLEAGLSASKAYLSLFPDDSIAVTVAWQALSALHYRGRSEAAIEAARAFLKKEDFQIPAEESAAEIKWRELIDVADSPLEQFDTLQKSALFLIGNLLFAQQKYKQAIEAYTEYTVRFPNGPDWTAAQRGIINAEYQIGVDLIAARSYEKARLVWDEFLARHPLDYRSRQILFALGQMEYQQGKDLRDSGDPIRARTLFESAIASYRRLISKYPQTEESGLAQLRIGEILENELGDLTGALEAYRKLTWSSMSGVAEERVRLMTKKEFVVRTERIYSTDERSLIHLQLRNVQSLKVSAYRLDLEDYFRKYHTIEEVEQLDLSLISPDSAWEVPVEGYQNYLPISMSVEIPMEGPGVYAVNLAEEDIEATTLVIRSDIDIIVKSSRSEVLVFAQNRRTGRPVPGANVLITDGSQAILEEKTNGNGILHRKLDKLRGVEGISVFVDSDGNVASNNLSLYGLGFGQGLAPKGYIYTDRPVYKPGEPVKIRGIVREVVDGSYAVQRDADMICSVTDSNGRRIFEKEIELSRFGTFQESLHLGASTPQGGYSIRLFQDNPRRIFTGSFLVEEFRLERIRLTLDFDSNVYFRGDPITATFTASYYYGKPVGETEIFYRLPDGSEYSGNTDGEGRLRIQFDSTPYTDQSRLEFYGRLVSENVEVYGSAFLATQGYNASLSVARSISLAGEPIEITLRTNDVSGLPVSRAMEISVLRREIQKPDPLLVDIPWMEIPRVDTWAEKKVTTLSVTTDETGVSRFSFTPRVGGTFVYRARGTDRFGNMVVAETLAEVSGEEDQIRLRLFSDRNHYRVGERAALRIHSRLESPALVLMTHEGEGVISYEVIEIGPGEKLVEFPVDHSHFPNFVFAVALMDGNRLESASLPFTVERQLKITIQPEKQEYLPGENARITVDVKDHLGDPVESEFSLALVNEALFARYSDPAGDIIDFFQRDAFREAAMVLQTSCTFSYLARTVAVNRDIAEEMARLAELKDDLAGASMAEDEAFDREEPAAEIAASKAAEALQEAMKKEAKPARTTSGRARDEEGEAETRRREDESPALWLVAVTTKPTGRAVVSVPMPQIISSYRITVKGCTETTLVGESTASIVVKKPFFASLRTPELVQERDAVRFVCEIHNIGDYEGPVSGSLQLQTGDRKEIFSLRETIEAGEIRQVVFPPYTIPEGNRLKIALDVSAKPGLEDGLSKDIPIRAWGLPFADQKSGKASTDRTLFLELPPGRSYSNNKLVISTGASLNQELVDLVLGGSVEPLLDADPISQYFPATEPSELLALASLIDYLENKSASRQDLDRALIGARALVAALSASQLDSGAWRYGTGKSEIEVTALAYWALARANEVGIRVDATVLKRSEEFLRDQYSRVAQDAYESRAMILYSLSVQGGADFAFVNRLYRQRNSLSDAALAYTALCLHGLDRDDMGLELLSMLEKSAKLEGETDDDQYGTDSGRHWAGANNIEWNRNSVETTALVMLAFQALKPSDPLIEEGMLYLMSQKGRFGIRPIKAKGIVIAALTGYYKDIKEGLRDFVLEIAVNDSPLETLTVKGQRIVASAGGSEQGKATILVPASLIRSGRNKIDFGFSGTGEYFYAASLTGFSSDLDVKPSWEKPEILSKSYIHENLTYRGQPIGTSSMTIKELESTRVSTVRISLSGRTGSHYMVIEDSFPAGATVLKDTIRGSHSFVQVSGNRIYFFFEPGSTLYSISYQISGYIPGDYNVLPTMIRNTLNPSEMVLGKSTSLILLAPGESSSEPYEMNREELYGLGKATFDDGQQQNSASLKRQSLELLEELYGRDKKYKQREVAQMLLWLRSEPEFYDAKRLVEYFEILKENYPDLFIPFRKILVIGKAYHDIGEYERSYLVYRATVEASFLKDAPIGGALEQAGEPLGSIDFMRRLWREYPDSPPVVETYFALAQELYERAPGAQSITSRLRAEDQSERPTKAELMSMAEAMFWRFMALYPRNPLTDDAAFSRVNLTLDRKAYETSVYLCRQYLERFPESDFVSSFQYMEALGFFSMLRYNEAIEAAREVAESDSEDRDLAIYILGQIYHAKQNPAQAISYYKRVQHKFPDAREAAVYFERKEISLQEVSSFTPGKPVEIELAYRNIKEAHFQIFQVDLMKLYLKEKNLSRITGIKLSGISPQLETKLTLGSGEDYADFKRTIRLDLEKEGAYLVICRGDDLFASGLVLITPLEIHVQEDRSSGRIRVNVINSEDGRYAANVHVKVIGSENEKFSSGETDLRGIFVADGISGTPTVIVRDRSNRYAFYRGETRIGEPETEILQERIPETDYRSNTLRKQQELQEQNRMNLDRLYEEERDGVQVQEAY